MTNDDRDMEIYLALIATFWGAFLLYPIDTFGSSPTFGGMADLAPEGVWGFAMLVVGLAWLGGNARGLHRVRRTASFFSILLWSYVATMFMRANAASTATITYPFLVGACIRVYAKMGRTNAKQ